MKKTIALVALLLITATSSFAGTWTIAAGADVKAGPDANTLKSISKLSNNVALNGANDDNAFACATKHTNGTRQYATSSGDTKIYYKEGDVKDTLLGVSASDTSQFSSWSSL